MNDVNVNVNALTKKNTKCFFPIHKYDHRDNLNKIEILLLSLF